VEAGKVDRGYRLSLSSIVFRKTTPRHRHTIGRRVNETCCKSRFSNGRHRNKTMPLMSYGKRYLDCSTCVQAD
jgi:hypothetical protein